MKFTFTNIFSPDTNPNELGESLRNAFFNQNENNFGCYSTFELREDVEELPEEIVELSFYNTYTVPVRCFSKLVDNKKVIMKYWWDGDGTLEFHFEDGSYLYNGDCKKDYVWEYKKKNT